MPSGCPICSKPALADYRPFCSKRCADVDLQRWLVGRYAIPAAGDEADETDDQAVPITGRPEARDRD